MKKQLIIISSSHAREINELGDKPPVRYSYEPGFIEPLGETSAYIGWKVIEDSLKEYKITNINIDNEFGLHSYRKQYSINGITVNHTLLEGTIYDCEYNDSDLTCVIM